MPELPEVETTRRGITSYILGKKIINVTIRNRQLRWPIPRTLAKTLTGQKINKVDRRAKYLLLYTDYGCLILHLGMSGSLRIITGNSPPQKHDHVDIVFTSGIKLRYCDPRRFGSIHYTKKDPHRHDLLKHLGPEPLSDDCNGNYLLHRSRGRKQAVKTFIMDSRILVGIGNIYASESLFRSGIHPQRAAGRVSQQRYHRLADEIKTVLRESIDKGGTTIRDFVSGDDRPGYFKQELQVYDRAGLPCLQCGTTIKQIRQGQRSTYYCSKCQR